MKTTSSNAIKGSFQHLIYSPRGEVEGVLLQAGDTPVQLVIERHDEEAAAAFDGVSFGQSVVAQAVAQGPSPKGEPEHPVYDFIQLTSVDGRRPAKRKPAAGAAYRGKVKRFNYARHGAANGVVLDTGDFIHIKPEGMARLRLKIGDTVEADGDAQRLVDDAGWAVEATTVNGKSLHPR